MNDHNTELGRLLHDLRCTNPDDMYNPVLSARVRFLKETEEGQKIMSESINKLIQNQIDRVLEEVRKNLTHQLQLHAMSEEQINEIVSETLKDIA